VIEHRMVSRHPSTDSSTLDRPAAALAGSQLVNDPRQNQLLAALPAPDFQRLLPELVPIDMPAGMALHESGELISHVHFPTSSVVSLLYETREGGSAQIGVVGNEGVVGIALFMGGGSTQSRAVVLCAGKGYRLRSSVIRKEFDVSGPVMHLMLRFTQALITQTAQTAACSRYHSVDQQLCRWLLTVLDRLRVSEIAMTQELMASMIGVRREGITESALKLQRAGLIHYVRGNISILDRAGLEHHSCECYAAVRREYERLLPRRPAA
jgi:CRP-like cAMP-binding protein